jgi:hypothetical protein
MSVFGFSTAPSSGNGDFTPIVKYDARAGRFTRVDRVNDGNGFVNDDVDITTGIKFMADFENIEVGWLYFTPGNAPSFVLVPFGHPLPPQPSENHKNGLRFMLKLAPSCGGEQPIREIAGNSKAFLSGVEAVFLQYQAEKDGYPGKLPVLTVEKITPVKTGSGVRSSTNYHPVFKISGWAPRGDLVFEAKAVTPSVASQVLAATASAPTAPSTGSTRAAAPQERAGAPTQETVDSDFG